MENVKEIENGSRLLRLAVILFLSEYCYNK